MNLRFLGNTTCLAKYDLAIMLCKSFDLPLLYATMLTQPIVRNKGDKNATNYRIGAKNPPLLEELKKLFYSDDKNMSDIYELLREHITYVKTIASRNNHKAGNYRIGYLTYFNDKERETYFTGLQNLVQNTPQLILVDPDNGITFSWRSPAHNSGFIHTSEVKSIVDKMCQNSVLIVNQPLNNYLYNQEDRIKLLTNKIGTEVILIADEVIQWGAFILAKNKDLSHQLRNRLQYYLADYRFVKNSQRIYLGYGHQEGVTITSIGNFGFEQQPNG